MLVRCNVCAIDIDDSIVDEHVSTQEHRDNLERIRSITKKVYDEDSRQIGINP